MFGSGVGLELGGREGRAEDDVSSSATCTMARIVVLVESILVSFRFEGIMCLVKVFVSSVRVNGSFIVLHRAKKCASLFKCAVGTFLQKKSSPFCMTKSVYVIKLIQMCISKWNKKLHAHARALKYNYRLQLYGSYTGDVKL